MAIVADDWTINNGTKVIDYVGAAHGTLDASYATGIEFHRWLQDLADDSEATPSSNDFMDMTKLTPSSRNGIDQIIEMLNDYTITQTASEHLYDCSIIQGGGTDIWDGITVIANQGCNCQILQNDTVVANDFWNWGGEKGVTDGVYTSSGVTFGTATAGSSGATLEDSGNTWTTNEWVGYMIKNTTDGSQGVITANTADTITADLYGGTGDDFESGDTYYIGMPLNADASNGIAARFLLKVRTGGADIDGRKVIGTTRVWSKTYSEFKVNGTARGGNVIALNFIDDTNNTTDITTVKGWSADFTITAGYVGIDVDTDTTNENYWIETDINKPTRNINDAYEYWKATTVMGETATLAGLEGQEVRGITHEIAYTGTNGIAEGSPVTFSGGGVAQILADSGSILYVQLLSGSAPAASETFDTATCTVSTVDERTISTPFCGSSTGSALLGAFGFGITAADVTNNDRLVALDGSTYFPPNNQNFYVAGVESTEDQILVGPINAGETDIRLDQFAVQGALTGGETSIIVDAGTETPGTGTNSATDTPSSGTIRILGTDGVYHRVRYDSYTVGAGTMTFDCTTNGAVDTPAAADNANCFISYIDKEAQSTQESFLATYVANRDLWVRVRDGKASPIKTYEAKGTFSSSGGTVNVTRTGDE